MEGFKIIGQSRPQSIATLLSMTGQVHEAPFSERYDRVLALRGMELLPHMHTDEEIIGAVGINDAENRIVDIAVHPDFRKRGIGRVLVHLSGCDVAYTVNDEAAQFWKAIGWKYAGRTSDKGTPVDRWMAPEKATEVHMR